jgi:hypothetical protein
MGVGSGAAGWGLAALADAAGVAVSVAAGGLPHAARKSPAVTRARAVRVFMFPLRWLLV